MRKTHFIFGTMVLLLVSFFDGPLARQMVEQYFSTKYPLTTGQVTHSEVGSFTTYGGRTGGHIHYFPDIRYRYEINGQVYEGRRFCYAREYGEEFSRQVATDHPVGSQVQVSYNPKNLQDALLSPGFGQVDTTAIIRISIQANFVVAVVVMLWCVRIHRQARLQREYPVVEP